jgi:Domain of unknown function (DUF4124)
MMIRGLVCLCAALPCAAAAAMYKWVDEKGVTHYSESPPPDGKASRVELPPTAPSSAPAETVQTWKDRDIEFRRRRLEQEQAQDKADAAAKHAAAQREGRCLQARSRLDILQSERPVYHVNERGERVYLEDQERASAIEQWRKQADTYCDGR